MITVTFEGRPIEDMLKEEARAEAREAYAATAKAIAFIVARSRGTSARKSLRNHSGARTSRGRVISVPVLEGGAR